MPKPLPGQEYIDPSFGTVITRVTAANPAEGDNAVIKPLYSTMPAWNADESLLLLWHRGKGYELYQGQAPFAFIRALTPFHPTDIESLLWDHDQADTLYYPTNYNAMPLLVRHALTAAGDQRVTVQHDFSSPPTSCPRGDWSKLLTLGNDPQWMGRGPRKLLGLRCGSTGFVYSIAEDRVVSVAPLPEGYTMAPVIAPSETLGVFDRYVLDPMLRLVRRLTMERPYEHASLGRRSDGVDVWNTVAFDGWPKGSLVSYRLDDGLQRVVIGPPEWPYPPSTTHISSIGPAGWAAVGIVGQHHGQTVLDNEIVLANVETGEVCRIGHARTFAGSYCPTGCPWGYFSETHVNLSPSGTKVAFASDWWGGNTVDTYVIDLTRLGGSVQ